MSNISDILRQVANNFVALADELDTQEKVTNTRLDILESLVATNNQALKDAAIMLLNNLN